MLRSTPGTGCPPASWGPQKYLSPHPSKAKPNQGHAARPGHTRQIPREALAEPRGRPPGSYLPRDAPGSPSSSSGQAAAFPPPPPSSSAPHPLRDSGRVRKTPPKNWYFRVDPALCPRGAPTGAGVVGSRSCSQKDVGAQSKERAEQTELARGCKEWGGEKKKTR